MADKVTTPTQIVQSVTAVTEKAEVSSGFVTFHLWGHAISIYPMLLVLILIGAPVAFYLWKAQRDAGNDFDAFDLLMDEVPKPAVDTRRKASMIKIAFAVAFGVATWIVIDQEMRGTLSIDIFGPYLTVVFLSITAKLLWDKPFDPATILAMLGRQQRKED
jgi:hypothetical protein